MTARACPLEFFRQSTALGLLLWAGSVLFDLSCSPSATVAPTAKTRAPPSISATVASAAEPVFDTRQGCDETDIPDAIPRAFRDFNNTVHLIATHSIARAMTGPNLNALARDCRIVYRSPRDPDPADFLDENWLMSFYTPDGKNVAALAHTEYHGDEHPDMCGDLQSPDHSNDCAWTTITFAESHDGGFQFKEPRPPANLVASLPYTYDKYNKGGAQGYDAPTNLLKVGSYFYAMTNVWRQYREQSYGPCLMRAPDVFDPSSWRAWDGTDFRIRFIDPYVDRGVDTAQHVCPPVMVGTVDSLAVDQVTGVFLADVYVEDDRYGQGSGLYIMASRDLIHWSKPRRVVATAALLADEPPGDWSYNYFAILDPESADRNFATVSRLPDIYYVRLDNLHPPYRRVLFRRKIRISLAN